VSGIRPGFLTCEGTVADPILTAAQEAEARRRAPLIPQKAGEEAYRAARLLLSKPEDELLRATELEVRERVHVRRACYRCRHCGREQWPCA
jgi:hypothetical protein